MRSVTHYLLDEESEEADRVARIYGKSLLFLVSRSYQNKSAVVPIMGMQKHWKSEPADPRVNSIVTSHNSNQTRSDSHGGFDNDRTTMNHALSVLVGKRPKRLFEEEQLSGY